MSKQGVSHVSRNGSLCQVVIDKEPISVYETNRRPAADAGVTSLLTLGSGDKVTVYNVLPGHVTESSEALSSSQ